MDFWMRLKNEIKEGVAMAKLLETSAEYLVTGVKIENVSDTERKLIGAYRKLNSADRENVMLALNAWAGKKASG